MQKPLSGLASAQRSKEDHQIHPADLQRSTVPSDTTLSRLKDTVEDRTSSESASETRVSSAVTNAVERASLTPMEIDSPSTTPAYTPELNPIDLTPAVVKEEPVELSLSQIKTPPFPHTTETAVPLSIQPYSAPNDRSDQKIAEDSQSTSAITLVGPQHTDEVFGRSKDTPGESKVTPRITCSTI